MLQMLRRLVTSVIAMLVSSITTTAIIGAEWLLSMTGDGALLVFEALLTVLALATVMVFIQQADKLAGEVGTVRIGSPEEKQADRVLRHFYRAENTLEFFGLVFWPSALVAFFFLETHTAFYLHGGVIALTYIGIFWQGNRLNNIQKARGYSTVFGRLTP